MLEIMSANGLLVEDMWYDVVLLMEEDEESVGSAGVIIQLYVALLMLGLAAS